MLCVTFDLSNIVIFKYEYRINDEMKVKMTKVNIKYDKLEGKE